MQRAFQIIEKYSKQSGVTPFEMLVSLLDLFQLSNVIPSMMGFASGATNKANVFNEITGLMNLMQRPGPPTGMLDAIDMFLEMQHGLDSHNVTPLRDANRTADADALQRKAKAEGVLRQIIRELSNMTEHQALQARLMMEERSKQQNAGDDPQAEAGPT
jgi:hypothetical protein